MVTRDDFYCPNKFISASYYKGRIHAFPHMSESFSSNLTQFFSLAFWMIWMFCYTAGWHVVIQYELTWYIFHWSAQSSLECHTVYRTLYLVFGSVGSNNDIGKVLRPNSWTKSRDLGVFLLAIHSHLYSFALRLQLLKEKGKKLDRK